MINGRPLKIQKTLCDMTARLKASIMLLKKNQHVQFGIKIITVPRWVSFTAYK